MYVYEFNYGLAAVCAHHAISAAFHCDKHHSSTLVLVQRIQALSDVQLFVRLSVCLFVCLCLSSGESLSTQRLYRWPLPAGQHRTWRYCQQCIVSFSRTIYIFLRKILPAIYILSLFKLVLMGFEQFYFSPILVCCSTLTDVFSAEVWTYCLNLRWFECFLHLIAINLLR